jgi:hypothetical protein
VRIAGAGISVELPDPRDWDVVKDRPQEIAATLDGGAVISAWPKSVEGSTVAYSQVISEALYQELRALDEHATQTTWTVNAPDGDQYEAVINVASAPRVFRYGRACRDLNMNITVVRRISE